jgi:cation:H+ antiporter
MPRRPSPETDASHPEERHGIFHISKTEAIIAAFLTAFYLLARFVLSDLLLLLIAGVAFSLWLTFRASHLAIDGLESLGAFAALSAYVIGVLSSLASNTPEAVVTALTALRGITTGAPELVEIAVLSVILAAGFNILLLGTIVVVSSRKGGAVPIPRQVVEDDADLIRWTIVAMALLFAYGVIHYIAAIGAATPPSLIDLPHWAGLIMVLSYVLYTIWAIKKPTAHPRRQAKPAHSKRTSAGLAFLGFLGIFIAGYILSGTIELAFDHVPWTTLGIGLTQRIEVMAILIGAAGAIPEHGIALLAATHGKADIAIGNTLGGTTQILLLIVGGVGMIIPLPLDAAVLLQFATAAGSLWFLKTAITDDQRIDAFEGAMVLLMQTLVFIILLSPL